MAAGTEIMKKNQLTVGYGIGQTANAITNENTSIKVLPQVQDQVENMAKATNRLHEAIGTLVDRLQPCLRVEPIASADSPKLAPELVPLADRLRIETGGVVYAASRIEDLLSRLEV